MHTVRFRVWSCISSQRKKVFGVRRATPPHLSAGRPQPQDGGRSDVVGDVAQRDAPLDVAECGGERVVARARGDRRVGPRRWRRALLLGDERRVALLPTASSRRRGDSSLRLRSGESSGESGPEADESATVW